MYPQTKSYLKREILKLIAQTNDKEHVAGRVTVDDILNIVKEIKGD